jgi:hypothetical protein
MLKRILSLRQKNSHRRFFFTIKKIDLFNLCGDELIFSLYIKHNL